MTEVMFAMIMGMFDFGKRKYLLLIAAAFAVGVLLSPFFQVAREDKAEAALIAIKKAGVECPAGDRTKSILCLKKTLVPEVKKYGIRNFMTALEKDFLESNFYSGAGEITRCHDIAHAIGQIGGETNASLQKTVTECTEICTFGCYHGAVEGYLLKGGDFISQVPYLCLESDEDKTDSVGACLHGLGHGAASVAGFDLQRSLEICDLLGDDRRKINCSTGVFMELYEPSTFDHPLLEFPPDIVGFCRGLRPPYSETCLLLSGLHEYGRSGDMRAAFSVCGEIENILWRDGCFKNIGGNLYFSVQGNAQKIKELCSISESFEARENCLLGAIQSSVVSSSPEVGRKICEVTDGTPKICQSILNNKKE